MKGFLGLERELKEGNLIGNRFEKKKKKKSWEVLPAAPPLGWQKEPNSRRDAPRINSSGSKGDRATNSPPNPQPTSATVTGLTNGRTIACVSSAARGTTALGDAGATYAGKYGDQSIKDGFAGLPWSKNPRGHYVSYSFFIWCEKADEKIEMGKEEGEGRGRGVILSQSMIGERIRMSALAVEFLLGQSVPPAGFGGCEVFLALLPLVSYRGGGG